MGRVSVDLYPDQVGVRLRGRPRFARPGRQPDERRGGGRATRPDRSRCDEGQGTTSSARSSGSPSLRSTPPGSARARSWTLSPSARSIRPTTFPFYREPVAPDLMLEPWEADAEAIRAAGIFWATGTGLSREPSRSTTLDAFTVRGRRQHTIFDLDFRPTLWHPADDPAPLYRKRSAGRRSRSAICLKVAVAVGVCEPEEAASRLLDAGPEARGGQARTGRRAGRHPGAHDADPCARDRGRERPRGGDAFGGGLCRHPARRLGLERTIHRQRRGRLVAGRMGCADDMPTAEEVEAALCSG